MDIRPGFQQQLDDLLVLSSRRRDKSCAVMSHLSLGIDIGSGINECSDYIHRCL